MSWQAFKDKFKRGGQKIRQKFTNMDRTVDPRFEEAHQKFLKFEKDYTSLYTSMVKTRDALRTFIEESTKLSSALLGFYEGTKTGFRGSTIKFANIQNKAHQETLKIFEDRIANLALEPAGTNVGLFPLWKDKIQARQKAVGDFELISNMIFKLISNMIFS
ncbi:bridging integrator 3 [Anaeramoeba ignava]|uniref:Bridging integrator 3 n=1 Tax=Anaeramoeba ignava TaxID=1746090 RepID=A0A9Q0LBX8_ANAIG|nr:bridging integrator 3 [Anaeramoeba ignava]